MSDEDQVEQEVETAKPLDGRTPMLEEEKEPLDSQFAYHDNDEDGFVRGE